MKKSILLGLGACALALGGVAALVGQNKALRAEASEPVWSDAFIAGSMNSWLGDGDGFTRDKLRAGEQNEYRFQWVRTDNYGTSYYTLTIDLVHGQTFGIRDWHEGRPDEAKWCTYLNGEKVLYGIVLSGGTYKCTLDGTYTLIYKYGNASNRCIEYAEMSSNYKDIYVVNNASWTGLFAHSWKSDPKTDYDEWPSCTLVKPSGYTLGGASYDLYRLRVPSSSNKIIIAGTLAGNTKQTEDLDAVDGKCYILGETVTGLEQAGQIVGEILSYMGEASYNDVVYLDSICAIPGDKASDIVTKYDAAVAVEASKTILDASYIHTHNPEDLNTNIDIAIKAIRDRLAVSPSTAHYSLPSAGGNESSAMVVVGALTVGTIIGAGALFVTKRARRQDE